MSMQEDNISLSDVRAQLASQRLPRWEELPDLYLYMDQVLALIMRYLENYPGFDDKGLTSSMVNNYVKLGVVPPPVKKKYGRVHLAHLIIICVLKTSLPIASIQKLIDFESARCTDKVYYDRFCDMFEEIVSEVSKAAGGLSDIANDQDALVEAIHYSALRAQAEQTLAAKFMDALFSSQETAPPEAED